MSALAGAYTQIQATLAASTRIAGLFAIEPEVKDGPETITNFREGIVVRDVSFDYGGERVLEGTSFEVRKGEIVALVGPSGVGKSTLADLILRLYDPVAGTITIDGHDLRALRQEPYRRLFGVVPQEPLLFNASIRENIAYGRSDLAEADIVRAAQIANAHGFIGEFTDGYDTIVGDRGVRLSGGQRQRGAGAGDRRPAAHLVVGRGDQLARQRVRAPRAAGDRARHPGRHVDRHRPPAVDRAARGQDRRHESGPRRGGRPPRGSHDRERDLQPPVPLSIQSHRADQRAHGMTEFLKGNYELKVDIEERHEDAEASATDEFERKALSRLGGSICFVSKKGFLWTGDKSDGSRTTDRTPAE